MATIKGQLGDNIWHGHTPTIKVTGEYTVTDNKISVTSIKESRVYSDIVYPFPSYLYLCYSQTKFKYNENYVLSSVDNVVQLIQFSSADTDFSPDPKPSNTSPVEHSFAHYGYYCLAMKCGQTGGCVQGYQGYVLVSDIFERKDPSIKFSIIKDKVLVGQYLDIKISSIKGTWKLTDKRIPEGTSNSQKNNYKTIKTLGSYSKAQTISKYSQAGTKYGMYLIEASNGKKTVIQTAKVKLLPPNKNSTFTIQNNKVVKESNPPTKPKGAVLKSSVEGDHYLVWYEHNKGEYYPSDKLIVKKDGSGGGTKPPVPDPPSPGGDSSSFGPPELIVRHLHDSGHDPSPITVDETFSVTYSSDSAPKRSDVNKGSYDDFEYFHFTFHVEYGGVSKSGDSVTYDALPGDVDITAYFHVWYQLYKMVPDYDDEGNVIGHHPVSSSRYDIDTSSSSMTITGYCCPRDMLSSASDPYQITTDEEMSQSYVPIITTSNDYRSRVRLFTELWKKNNTVKVLSSTTTIHLDFETNDFAPRLDLGRFNYYKLEFVELPSQTSSGRDILIHEGSRSSDSFAISDYLSFSDDPTQFNSNELKRGERYQIRISCYCYYDGKVWRGNDTSTEQVGQTNIFIYGGDDGFILGGEPEPAEIIYPYKEGSSITYSKKPSLVFKAYNPDYIENYSKISGIKVDIDGIYYWATVKYLGDAFAGFSNSYQGNNSPYLVNPLKLSEDPDSCYKTIVANQGHVLSLEGSSATTDTKYENKNNPEYSYHIGVVSGHCPTWDSPSESSIGNDWKYFKDNYVVNKNNIPLTYGQDYVFHRQTLPTYDKEVTGTTARDVNWIVFDFKEVSSSDTISIVRIIYDHTNPRRNSKGQLYLTSLSGGLVEFQLPEAVNENTRKVKITVYNDLEEPVIYQSQVQSLGLGLSALKTTDVSYTYNDLKSKMPPILTEEDNNSPLEVIADKRARKTSPKILDVASLIGTSKIDGYVKRCLLSYRNFVGAYDDQLDESVGNFNLILRDLFSPNDYYYNPNWNASSPLHEFYGDYGNGRYIKSDDVGGYSPEGEEDSHKLLKSWLRSLEYCHRIKTLWTKYLDSEITCSYENLQSNEVIFLSNLYRSRTGSHYSQIKFVHNEEEILRLLEGKDTPSEEELRHLCLVEVSTSRQDNPFKKIIFDIREFGFTISSSVTGNYSITAITSPYCFSKGPSSEFESNKFLGSYQSNSPVYTPNFYEFGDYQILVRLYPYEDTTNYIYDYYLFKNKSIGVMFRVNLYGRFSEFKSFNFNKQTTVKDYSPEITPTDFKVRFDLEQGNFKIDQEFTVPSGKYGWWTGDQIRISFNPENVLSWEDRNKMDLWYASDQVGVSSLYTNEGTGKGVTQEGYVAQDDGRGILVLKINGTEVKSFSSYYEFIYRLMFEAEEVIWYDNKNNRVLRQKEIVTKSGSNTYYHSRMKLLDQRFIPLGDLNSERGVPINAHTSEEHFEVSNNEDDRYYGNVFNNIIYGLGQVM